MSNAILNEQEIVDSSVSVDGFSGVYFLVAQGKVVYVGQSTNIFSRLQSHGGSKKFDSIKIIPCHRLKLNSLESVYIHSLRPKLNARHGDGCMVAPLSFASALKMEDSVPGELLVTGPDKGKTEVKKDGWISLALTNLKKDGVIFNPYNNLMGFMTIFFIFQYYIQKNDLYRQIPFGVITLLCMFVIFYLQYKLSDSLSQEEGKGKLTISKIFF